MDTCPEGPFSSFLSQKKASLSPPTAGRAGGPVALGVRRPV